MDAVKQCRICLEGDGGPARGVKTKTSTALVGAVLPTPNRCVDLHFAWFMGPKARLGVEEKQGPPLLRQTWDFLNKAHTHTQKWLVDTHPHENDVHQRFQVRMYTHLESKAPGSLSLDCRKSESTVYIVDTSICLLEGLPSVDTVDCFTKQCQDMRGGCASFPGLKLRDAWQCEQIFESKQILDSHGQAMVALCW